ncbi:MAG: primosomal protein N' [Spirochaetota bacterium]|nr:primosomal protein N' [Spirochaetota bacterium]
MRSADVYVGYPVDGVYTYNLPDELDVPSGVRVKVNFNNRITTAFVANVRSNGTEYHKLKDIISVIDDEPIFDVRLIDLSQYIASNYLCTVGEVISMALPSGERPSNRYKNPLEYQEGKDILLTDEQRTIYDNIINSQGKNKLCHLIYGITGSGKTEVFIEIAKYIRGQNRSVIYLVPEISISSQVYKRLYDVFGNDLIIYHSHQTPNQRLYNWKRFYSGEAKIAIGTRSAVFLQCPDLGLIIIDEEHDPSYKEHSTPRYNVRRIAFYRSRNENSLLVMGSATPSIESLYSAERGIFRLHSLNGRYGAATLPKIEIVRIDPPREGDMLSSILKLYSKRAIEEGNQVLYFLNKRGFSPIVLCESCGSILECPQCSISLNYHNNGYMLCHYCGYRRRLPEKCLECDSGSMIKLGAGTQRVENAIRETFSNARIFRLDQDTSRKKNFGFKLIDQMEKGEIDILLGTQMIAKGFDFQNVSLVGVVMADIGLNLPDFRAAERIFSLLIQIAGRCGRGQTPGNVIVQTLDDTHYIFSFLKNHDYMSFYKHELSLRRMLDYPPFSRIVRLLVRGRKENRVMDSINRLRDVIKQQISEGNKAVILLGPSQAPLSKIANNYRYHLILKSKDINELKRIVISTRDCIISRDVYLEIDIDPYDML